MGASKLLSRPRGVEILKVAQYKVRTSSPLPLPELYFDSFSYPVAPIFVSNTGGIVESIYL